MKRALAMALLAATLAGCVAAPKAPPVPPVRPSPVVVTPPPAPPAPPSQPWDELPVIEGAWELAATGRSARFVDDAGAERASLTCTAPGRSVQLGLTSNRAARMDILTSSLAREVALQGGVVVLPVADPLLDAIAFSRGRFGLWASQLLVLPVQAEIGRLIEDCRG
jgi:hypothetical protein